MTQDKNTRAADAFNKWVGLNASRVAGTGLRDEQQQRHLRMAFEAGSEWATTPPPALEGSGTTDVLASMIGAAEAAKAREGVEEELRKLLEKASPQPWVANVHHTKDYAGRTHAFVTAGSVVPLAAVVLAAEGCDQEEGRANARLIPAMRNHLPALLSALAGMREALRPFAEIALLRDSHQTAPDMIDGPDLAITPAQIRAARAALQRQGNA